MNEFVSNQLCFEGEVDGRNVEQRDGVLQNNFNNNDLCPQQSLVFACCWKVALWKARHSEETPESRSQASFPGRIENIFIHRSVEMEKR